MLFSRTAQQAPHDLRYPLPAVRVANRDQVSPPARLSTIVKLEFCGGANGNKGSMVTTCISFATIGPHFRDSPVVADRIM